MAFPADTVRARTAETPPSAINAEMGVCGPAGGKNEPLVPMRAALADPRYFGEVLAGDSWANWRVLLIAIAGEALNPDELAVFKALDLH